MYESIILPIFSSAGFKVVPINDDEDLGRYFRAFFVTSEDKPTIKGIQARLVINKTSCNLISRTMSVLFDSAEIKYPESISLFRNGEFAGMLFL